MENQARSDKVAALQHAIVDEVLHYLGWPESGFRRRLIVPLLRRATRRFIRLAAGFDEEAARAGFCVASRRVLPEFIPGFAAHGAENIPAHGPLILACNHPGTVDALVAAASLPRDDFKAIARDMPFLRLLPGTNQYLIFERWTDVQARMMAVRAAIRHLQAGGVLLLFPSGDLDPDPACLPGALKSVETWSKSLELLLRKVPEARLQVAIISRVLEPRYLEHPIARFRKDLYQKQISAEIIQVIQQMLFGRRSQLAPRISFGAALEFEGRQALDDGSLRMQILEQARRLVVEHSS